MITVKGIRLESLSTTRDGDKEKITGSYSLMSSDDKVLAKQSFNGYSDLEVNWSPETIKLHNAFMKAAKSDIETLIGVNNA
jgi:hypothetical protein